ncbi:MAG: glycoside hydrolase family 88 protein [Luteolibacter sp.]
MHSTIQSRHPSIFGRFILLALATVGPLAAADPKPDEILRDMKRVADWQLANPSKHALYDWTQAPFFMGLANLHQVSGEEHYQEALDEFGKKLNYGPGPNISSADDHAVLQGWLDLPNVAKDQAKLRPSIELFERLTAKLAKEAPKSISGGSFTWCWCDALFMSPGVWSHLSAITGDPKYVQWADREWWTTTDVLYDATHHLFYRDNRFFTKRTPSGKKIFWARGNGWVCGGLTNVLDYLPADHPSREKYLGLYHDMMYALLKLQNEDGLWRTSLLDTQDPAGESSGSAFFIQSMAWGINRGLLPEETFKPIVMKAYQALSKNIQPSGMLGFIQKIGDSPEAGTTAESTEVYGSGAFLLAGSELIRMLDPTKRRNDVATFKGVNLPEKFLPAAPRTFARFVPERSDDFAWENDVVAFRTYGPALRPGAENSGIDCWFKRVPYPIIDKWYLQDRLKLPYGNVNKPYHQDQGDGLDIYHVGNSRGCGGISVVVDGEMHDSDTFIAHRVISSTPERTVFELDYASDLKGKVLRETKRITLVMGQHLFQCDSRFTLDGKPAALDVAIGLSPQVKGTQPVFSPATGTMQLWETMEGLGLGTGIVIDPKRVVKMESHANPGSESQAFCFARTDGTGHIRWFAGFGWEGQGDVTTSEQWTSYLANFAEKFVKTPYADYTHDASFKTHQLDIPADVTKPTALNDVPGAVMVKPNGGWCWFQDPRVIVTKDGNVVFTTISGESYGGYDAGDLCATQWNPETGKLGQFELSNKFQSDDHDVAALMERPDGKILAVYGKHSTDRLQRWRITNKPGDISSWAKENTFDVGDKYSYSNVFRLSAENGRTYNFSRSRGYNPNCNISEDEGSTWKYGWSLFSWTSEDLKNNPGYTGIDGCRPYVRYASNGTDTIHFVTTEDHPRAFDNSIYHGFYRGGKIHDSTGKVLADTSGGLALKPTSFTKIFDGGADKVAWTTDLELDAKGNPYTAFSVQMDGAKDRGKQGAAKDGMDHRYFYARFDGSRWETHQMAFAGTRLYPNEDDYTGLVALDPQDPDTAVISTNADPSTGTPLTSKTDQKRHWELFRGKTTDGGKSWSWTAITHDSTADNLRPIIPSNPGGPRITLWTRGRLKTYTDFHLDVFALTEPR